MDALTLILLVIGLGLLVIGANLLVRGASSLAALFGISPLVIGLTVVAFGTSSPEMAVSVSAALSDQADIAVGNVVGSNIFNVLFILGLCAVIAPLIVNQQLIRLDVPVMIGVSVLLLALCLDGNISRLDGLILFAGIVAYTVFSIVQSRRETNAEVKTEYETEYGQDKLKPRSTLEIARNVAFVLVGLVLLVIGARWLVDGAIAIASALGVSQLVIGLTIVAAGTSLPEVAASIVATLKGERDIAVGNVIGSNIFNILGILGLSSILAPNGLPVAATMLAFDLPVMIAVALACLPIFFTGLTIRRWEGWLFLAYYVAYTVYLILLSTQNPALRAFGNAMLFFALPLTVVTLLVVSARAFRRARAS